MLHPTNMPDCAPELECLLDFQERLLEFACHHSAFSQPDLVSEFGQPIADWLHDNRQLVLDPLKPYMHDATEEEKLRVLAQFKHDRTFSHSVEDDSYRFELVITGASSEFLKSVKQLLVGYYVQLTDAGFHPGVCRHGQDGLSRKHWWSGYESANPGRHTCAVCDASLAAGGKTIEHYFPKKQYPALSTHPSNLLPLCRTCNNDIKQEKDPLAHGALTTIFLPYCRYVRPDIRLDFADATSGGYRVELKPINDDPSIQQRIASFEFLFDISRRWTGSLAEVAETAMSRARDYLDAMRDNGKIVTAETIPAYVDATCTRMERNWGKQNYEYLATEWLRWARTNKPAIFSQLG